MLAYGQLILRGRRVAATAGSDNVTTTPEALVAVAKGVGGLAQPSRTRRRAAYDHRAREVGAPREVGGRGPAGGEEGASHTPTAAAAGASR
jgi:hypothetical protein